MSAHPTAPDIDTNHLIRPSTGVEGIPLGPAMLDAMAIALQNREMIRHKVIQ
jgi:hypothetical protein